MSPSDTRPPCPTRATIESSLREAFLALNEMAASLAAIERSCRQVLDELPAADASAVDNALALRAATVYAQMTLERTGDVSAALTSVARYIGQLQKESDASCRTDGAGADARAVGDVGSDRARVDGASPGPVRDRGQFVSG
jgi:hypothetical protein